MPLPLALIPLIAGGAQSIIGAIGQGKANKQLNRLFKQRQAYQTPQEIFDIVNMTANNAQTGLGAETLDYLTGQADRGLSSSLDAATRLGADPNQLSGLLDSYFQDIFKIGNENELAKMKKFDSLISANQLLAQNKDAEWASRENILKDQMQATGAKAAAGLQNVQSGVNLGLNALTALGMPKYPTSNAAAPVVDTTVSYNNPLGGTAPVGTSGGIGAGVGGNSGTSLSDLLKQLLG